MDAEAEHQVVHVILWLNAIAACRKSAVGKDTRLTGHCAAAQICTLQPAVEDVHAHVEVLGHVPLRA